ncbi:MAG: hypothetical protein ABIG93_01405 [archaeon]
MSDEYKGPGDQEKKHLDIGKIVNGLLGEDNFVTALYLVDNLDGENIEALYAGIAAGIAQSIDRGGDKLKEDRKTGDIANTMLEYCKGKAPSYFSNNTEKKD